jgi:hypothetical protein
MKQPTSEGSQMKVFPLNSPTSFIIPFLILDHLNSQGTRACSYRDVYTVKESIEEESIF